jgi:NADPH:quinone reductase-like Zn-dependent oxidoreductase
MSVLKRGDVVIKVAYVGLNPKDWKFPSDFNIAKNSRDDIAVIVEQVGERVLEFKPGDRVIGRHRIERLEEHTPNMQLQQLSTFRKYFPLKRYSLAQDWSS